MNRLHREPHPIGPPLTASHSRLKVLRYAVSPKFARYPILENNQSWLSIICIFRSPAIIITLAISKCYGKVRVLFFPRDNSLISRGNSHVSRVRGLVVRCLLFNPEVSCSTPWVCANFLTSIPKHKFLTFFGTMRIFGFVRLFFRNFSKVPKESSFQFFDILQHKEC